MTDLTYFGVAAEAERERVYLDAERDVELRNLQSGVAVDGTPANPNEILLDDEVPF